MQQTIGYSEKGPNFEYRTVQYEFFCPEFIAAPSPTPISPVMVCMNTLCISQQMTVMEYREQRRENEDALLESRRCKPRTFLAFYKKWKRHQQYKLDMRQYQQELYGKCQTWMTTRNEINREYGFSIFKFSFFEFYFKKCLFKFKIMFQKLIIFLFHVDIQTLCIN